MNNLPDDMPRDLADMLGRVAANAMPRRTTIEPTPSPSPVKCISEDGFWSVLLHDKDIGYIERLSYGEGYRAVTKTNELAHFNSFNLAKEYLVRNAI
jgi:hypothetical protein